MSYNDYTETALFEGRRSGRTTRMLRYAIDLVMEGRHVTVVFAYPHMAKIGKDQFLEMGGDKLNPALYEFTWYKNKEVFLGINSPLNHFFLFDHFVKELQKHDKSL